MIVHNGKLQDHLEKRKVFKDTLSVFFIILKRKLSIFNATVTYNYIEGLIDESIQPHKSIESFRIRNYFNDEKKKKLKTIIQNYANKLEKRNKSSFEKLNQRRVTYFFF